MKLTSRGKYAITAVLDVLNYSDGLPVRVQDIAERQNIPVQYLAKLFKELRAKKIVKSFKGPNGGYILHNNPEHIFVRDVLLAVREELDYQVEKGTTDETTVLNDFLKEVESEVYRIIDIPITQLRDRQWKI